MSKIHIGIDVGGTFTHAVAVESKSLAIVGKEKVLTTHTSSYGVAEGIVTSLLNLLEKNKIDPKEVSFIAHSTTQATNALLEGDVAQVGLLYLGKKRFFKIKNLDFDKIPVSTGKYTRVFQERLDLEKEFSQSRIKEKIEKLRSQGAKVIVCAVEFAPDDPGPEIEAVKIAQQMQIPGVGTHQISGLYGLKTRIKTAIVNAAILPKMMETANMTEDAVKKSGIKAPLMIMRSDGGVMTIDEMRKKPLFTLLSGPAAGVAAALMYLKISDGIFVEVGGTSTDISVIKDGQVQVRSAVIGGHKLFMRTLDVRTCGIGGGSLPRLAENKIVNVGPRSAHIANLSYSSFYQQRINANSKLEFFSPLEGDPADYVRIANGNQKIAFTATCAANYLKLIPDNDYAFSNSEETSNAVSFISSYLGFSPEKTSQIILQKAVEKLEKIISGFIDEYKLDLSFINLVGGGGGASVFVPFLAKKLNLPFTIAPHAEVISAIGVSLALVYDIIEQNIINSTPDDVIAIKRKLEQKLTSQGVVPSTIVVNIEIDRRKNLVKAHGSGSLEFRTKEILGKVLNTEEKKQLAAKLFNIQNSQIQHFGATNGLDVFGWKKTKTVFWIFKKKETQFRVFDNEGSVKLAKKDIGVVQTKGVEALETLKKEVSLKIKYTDAGLILPEVYLLFGYKIIDLSKLSGLDQIVELAKVEMEGVSVEEPVVIII